MTKKKKTLYAVSSNIIDFWFAFCFSQREELDRGNDEIVYKEFLKQFPTYYGFKFERMVIDLLPAYLKAHGIEYRRIGKDWGKEYEFDIVVEGDNAIYIGEIKKGELNVPVEIGKVEAIVRVVFVALMQRITGRSKSFASSAVLVVPSRSIPS